MAATKRQMNWGSVGFTPTSGSLSTATGVTQVQVKSGANILKFSGDGDRGPSLVVNDFNEPSIEVTTADLAWLLGLTPGATGSFTATHKDALGATSGAIVYTLDPCVVESPDTGGQHRQIGSGTVTFNGYFSDGTTDPLSFTRS